MNSQRPSYTLKSSVYKDKPSFEAGLAFVGSDVDERGKATLAAIKECGCDATLFYFDAANHQFCLDGVETRLDRVRALMTGKSRILIDATTLGLGEILLLLDAARKNRVPVLDILYAEPGAYTKREADDAHPQQRDYPLTTNCKFSAIQGFAHEFDSKMKSTHVFMVGFEAARVLNAIEQRGYEDEGNVSFHAVLGLPAFRVGWESNAIRPHLSVFEDLKINESKISYCQANSVRESYLTLWDLYRGLGEDQACFYVSPLGTKPHALGAALFLVETRGADIATSLYYDHPTRVTKRSEGVGSWHLTSIELP